MAEEQGSEVDALPVKKPWEDPMDEFQKAIGVGTGLILWVVVCIGIQYGWLAGVGWYLILPFAFGAVLGLVVAPLVIFRSWDLSPLAGVVYLLPVVTWLVAGYYNPWRDALLYLILLPVAAATSGATSKLMLRVGQWAAGSHRPGALLRRMGLAGQPSKRLQQLGHAFLFLAVFWSLTSLGDHLSGPRWGLQRSVLGTRRAPAEAGPRQTEPAIGLALSGGGFRAALLHAGVISALNEERERLTVRAVSSVSGGSIIAGAFVMGARPEEFKEAVADRRFNLRRDLVNVHNFVRLPFPAGVGVSAFGRYWQLELMPFGYEFSRSSVLERQLDRVLFGGSRLVADARDQDPLWIIGATDLLTGDAIGITRYGVYRQAVPAVETQVAEGYLPRLHSESVFDRFLTSSLEPDSVSHMVAASSAFPGAFPDLPVRYREQKDSSPVELRLADGGLTDNSGVALLLAAWLKPPPEWRPRGADEDADPPFEVVIASNGGKRLEPLAGDEPFLTPVRALDIVYASSGVFLTKEAALARGGPTIVVLDPAQALPESVSWVHALLDLVKDGDSATAPVDQAEVQTTLARELPDRLLRRLRRTIPVTGLPKQLEQEWKPLTDANPWLVQDERTNERLRVVLDYYQALEAFDQTSTLNDVVPRQDVEALFRLGRYLVQLNWIHIETALNRTPV